jgi:hypothetical protein
MITMMRAAMLLPAVGVLAAAQAEQPSIATYEARYAVQYKGRNVGTSQFTVSYDEERATYRFASSTAPKGLLKLARPNPAIERSDFVTENGMIRPLEFWYEDGSRGGEDNFHVAFDWDNGVALVNGEHGERELSLAPGTLDRGSLQVALMRDLEADGRPGTYWLVDDDDVQQYEYAASGSETLDTPIGEVETRVFVQQREGSSRSTWLWMAPTLRYLPVRVEQRRDGETRSALILESVEGL